MKRIDTAILLLVVISTQTAAAGQRDVPDELTIQAAVAALSNPDPEVRKQAVATLRVDRSAIEESPLDEEQRGRLKRLRRSLKPLLKDLIAAIDSPDDETVQCVALLLGEMDRDASEALPALERRIREGGLSENPLMLLVSCATQLTPRDQSAFPLFELLVGPTGLKPHDDGLKEFDPLAPKDPNRGPLPDWNEVHLSGSANAAGMYARWFMLLGRTRVEVPAILRMAGPDRPRSTRVFALQLLANFKQEARSAAPGLRRLMNDKNRLVRFTAASALFAVDPETATEGEIVKALKLNAAQEQEFRKMVAESRAEDEMLLEYRREKPDEWIERCLEMLKAGKSPAWDRAAIRALGNLESLAWPALPVIQVRLIDRDEETRNVAAEAIRRIERKAPEKPGWNLSWAY